MMDFNQGDIIKISGFKGAYFLIISKNTFIRVTGVFHVCPLANQGSEGPLHIAVTGKENTSGVAMCEQIKLIDPQKRNCTRIDRIPYEDIMNISDAIQGVFEYD